MTDRPLHVVTGALGYSGRRIARRLLQRDLAVRTLTNSPNRPNPFGDALQIEPFHFDDPDALTRSLEGADVLYNTYWVRFNHGSMRQVDAVRNTETLFKAACRAGVRRIVHISITNPDADSPWEYFRHKAHLESVLSGLGVPHTIVRPTVLFGGGEDILLNNIAWSIRRFPVFPLFGRGHARLQPVHVEDLARLAVQAGTDDLEAPPCIIQAIGPETFTFREMVQTIADAIGRRVLLVPAPAPLAYMGGRVMGRMLGDIMLTWPEVRGLMAEKLFVDTASPSEIRLSDWAKENGDQLGRRYAGELARRKHRDRAYKDL